MDNMRNLRGSLPTPSSRNRQAPPPADLLQTFKQAALNVTNLYRQATEDMAIERRAGYQDAIYELLALLDKENIGLGDGEGWRIRRWATEKQQLGPERDAGSEQETDANEADDRDASPTNEEEPAASSPVRDVDPDDTRSEAAATTSAPLSHSHSAPSGDFTFTSGVSYPNMQVDGSHTSSETHPTTRTTSVRQGSVSRGPRRGNHNQQRHGHRTARSLGPGAGSKRRDHFGDLFGLGNLDKDPFGGHGPKRPRPS